MLPALILRVIGSPFSFSIMHLKTYNILFNADFAATVRVRAKSKRAAVKTVKELWSESSDRERRQLFKLQALETTLEFCEATGVLS